MLARLEAALAAAGVGAKVIYSGSADVDVLAPGAGKGRALEFLLRQLTAAVEASPNGGGGGGRSGGGKESAAPPLPGGVQVNGDSGNDAELFLVPGARGCVVANAHPELLAFAREERARRRQQAQRQQQGAGQQQQDGQQQQQQQQKEEDGANGGDEIGDTSFGIYLARQPCAGAIVEALEAFGSVAAARRAAPPAELAARRAALALAAALGGALGGDGAEDSAAFSAAGEWRAADGRALPLADGVKAAALALDEEESDGKKHPRVGWAGTLTAIAAAARQPGSDGSSVWEARLHLWRQRGGRRCYASVKELAVSIAVAPVKGGADDGMAPPAATVTGVVEVAVPEAAARGALGVASAVAIDGGGGGGEH